MSVNLNGRASKLRDRFPRAKSHIKWNAGDADWLTESGPLTDEHLKAHADGQTIYGTYPAWNGVATVGIIDVDLHLDREPEPEEIAAVEAYAKKKYQELLARGVDARLLRHHFHGSYHTFFFVSAVAADRLGRWLKTFVADAGTIHVDTFPSETGGGNAVRLPGKHHRRGDNWTAVYNGTSWDEWPAPVEALLELKDNDAELFPDLGAPEVGETRADPDPEDAAKAVKAVADHWPGTGHRRDAGLALAGGLLRAKFRVAWVEVFVRNVAEAAQDEEVEKRVRGVADTRKKLAAEKKVTGWTRLSELLGEHGRAVVQAVWGWLKIDTTIRFGDGGEASREDDTTPAQPKWGDPAPLPTMPAVPLFPVGLFPGKVADYWSAAAESLAYPVDYVAVPALPLLGAAAGRSVAVELKRTYKEPALLWCGLVAPPGAAKSPSLTFAQGPLPRIAEEWVAEYAAAMKEYKVKAMVYENDVKEWKKNKCQGDPPQEPERLTVRQLVWSNFTVENLIRGNHANPRGVALCKDELAGLVNALNQYKGGKGDDRQNLLSMWAGVGIVYNREKDRQAGIPPLTMANTFLAVSGMIQPDLLAAFRGDVGREHEANDGWADRFLIGFPDPPPAQGESWATVSEELETGYADVFAELLGWEMVPVCDEDGNPVSQRPYYVPFDGTAEKVWEEFTWSVAERMNKLDAFDSYRGVLSKFKHHGLRLTALVHCLRRACGEVQAHAHVDGETVRRAVELVGYFEAHGKRALGVGWMDQRTRVARRILAWLSRNPGIATFTRSDAFIQLKDEKDVRRSEKLDGPFRLLIDLNYLRPLPPTAGAKGRPAEAYQVNPAFSRNLKEPIPNIPNKSPGGGHLGNSREGFSENSGESGAGFPYEEVL